MLEFSDSQAEDERVFIILLYLYIVDVMSFNKVWQIEATLLRKIYNFTIVGVERNKSIYNNRNYFKHTVFYRNVQGSIIVA